MLQGKSSNMTFSKEGLRHNSRLVFQHQLTNDTSTTSENDNKNNNTAIKQSAQQQLASSRGATSQSSMDLLTRKSKNALSSMMARTANNTRSCPCCDREFASMAEMRHHLSGTSIKRLGVKNHIEWLEGLDDDDDNEYYEALDRQTRAREQKQQQMMQARRKSMLERQQLQKQQPQQQRRSVVSNTGGGGGPQYGRRRGTNAYPNNNNNNNNIRALASESFFEDNTSPSMIMMMNNPSPTNTNTTVSKASPSPRRVSDSFGQYFANVNHNNNTSTTNDEILLSGTNESTTTWTMNNNNTESFSGCGDTSTTTLTSKRQKSFMRDTRASSQRKIQNVSFMMMNNNNDNEDNSSSRGMFGRSGSMVTSGGFLSSEASFVKGLNDRSSSPAGSPSPSQSQNQQLGLYSIRITSVPLVNSVIEATFNKICEFGKIHKTASASSVAASVGIKNYNPNNGNTINSSSSAATSVITFHGMYKYLISTATNVRQYDLISSKTNELRSEFVHYCSTRGGDDAGSRQQTKEKLNARKSLNFHQKHLHQNNNTKNTSPTSTLHTKTTDVDAQRDTTTSPSSPLVLSDAHYMTLAQFKQFLIHSPTAALFTAYQKAALSYTSMLMATNDNNNNNNNSKQLYSGGLGPHQHNNNNNSNSSTSPEHQQQGGSTTNNNNSGMTLRQDVDSLPYSYFASSTFEEKLRQQNKGKTYQELESVADAILAQPIQKVKPPNFSALEQLGHNKLAMSNKEIEQEEKEEEELKNSNNNSNTNTNNNNNNNDDNSEENTTVSLQQQQLAMMNKLFSSETTSSGAGNNNNNQRSARHRRLNVTTMSDMERQKEREAVLNRVVKHARDIRDRQQQQGPKQ